MGTSTCLRVMSHVLRYFGGSEWMRDMDVIGCVALIFVTLPMTDQCMTSVMTIGSSPCCR